MYAHVRVQFFHLFGIKLAYAVRATRSQIHTPSRQFSPTLIPYIAVCKIGSVPTPTSRRPAYADAPHCNDPRLDSCTYIQTHGLITTGNIPHIYFRNIIQTTWCQKNYLYRFLTRQDFISISTNFFIILTTQKDFYTNCRRSRLERT